MQVDVLGHAVHVGTARSDLTDTTASAVVFVHGAGFDHSAWVMPARHYARKGWRVIAPDLPAHGRSGGMALDSIEAMADWLSALLDALAVDAAAVVGHSMGSLVALAAAGRHPARVTKLALLGTSATMRVAPVLLDAARDDHPAAFDMANSWSHSTAGRRGGLGNPGVWIYGSARRLLQRCAPGVYHADLRACDRFAGAAYLDRIGVPALIIAGARDQMTPARAGLALSDKLANAQHLVLPGSGHALMTEQPNAVLDALVDFL